MVPGEELSAVPLIVNQVRQVLYAGAHAVILDDRIELAGLFNRPDHADCSPLLSVFWGAGTAIPLASQ